MKNILVAISITGLTLASATAMAGEDFASYDTDGNGAISLSEAKVNTALIEQFKDLDVNADGELNETEFSNFNG
ncbi:calmodulin [Pseudoalteromonas piscicida]|uniref:Calmodulin n=1 Tax=Pseudoalteromonas piscicida TaxID=43662 RepID=A0A2A5JTX9_PSEO7|nr:calmodulin [Pseudoalteromonas piscicida]PCK32923.1 calmodulin [Pseudoalteromonas piscicida]